MALQNNLCMFSLKLSFKAGLSFEKKSYKMSRSDDV